MPHHAPTAPACPRCACDYYCIQPERVAERCAETVRRCGAYLNRYGSTATAAPAPSFPAASDKPTPGGFGPVVTMELTGPSGLLASLGNQYRDGYRQGFTKGFEHATAIAETVIKRLARDYGDNWKLNLGDVLAAVTDALDEQATHNPTVCQLSAPSVHRLEV